MDNVELHNIIKEQAQMISQLTLTVNHFMVNFNCHQNGVNIENSISSKAESFKSKHKEIEELMRLNKGMRRRKDGRYDWRKMVQGETHYLIHACPFELAKQIRQYKKENLKPNKVKPVKTKESRKLIDLAWKWYNLNKKGKIKAEKLYELRLNKYVSKLDKNIDSYTKDDIIAFLNGIEHPKPREKCFHILSNVFAEAAESGIIKRNIIATLKPPKIKTEKGTWYNPVEQKMIYENRHSSPMGHEIEFIIMIGCRIGETFNRRLELDKLRVWVERSKADGTSGYVNISPTYAKHLEVHWDNMFKMPYLFYSRRFNELLARLEIKRNPNDKPLHRLRHTFSTNLYYLGANDKRRSYLMGHKRTSITNDVYTDFEMDVTKQEILDIYGDLYPTL